LAAGFADPPDSAKLRAYWWWLNGNVTRESITRDLEGMRRQGFGGAILCDAGGADQDGNAPVPHGPTFFSPAWRALYRFTLGEATRLGLEMSLNIQSGWNVGGPMVPAADAAKQLVWSEIHAGGPAPKPRILPEPQHADAYYRDLLVIAFPAPRPGSPVHPPIENLAVKAVQKPLGFSAPDTSMMLRDLPDTPGEEDARSSQVLDLTGKMAPDGTLNWEAPPGEWVVQRFGITVGAHPMVSTSSDGWKGYAVDVLDEGAFRRYWEAVVAPLIADAGPLAGRTLKYLHTDSWEIEGYNWTGAFREEFNKRRGYDLLPFLPIMSGRIIDSRSASDRFLGDFRKTLGDLAVDHHYRPFVAWAHAHGMQIHCESGGPHAVPIDAQRCLGQDDVPMSEFWAWSWTHRIGDKNRFFVKQPASAAHTYGRPLVCEEGFTSIGPHWQETLWDNLKPAFDHASCEGSNRLVWHAFVSSPAAMGFPGQQYFAGTHLNPNVTWWSRSAPFFSYLNRVQFLLQQGQFVADACYYYGDRVPNFAQVEGADPAGLGRGYDYDVNTEEALLERATARDRRIVLPDGMSYGLLVLPNEEAISLPVLRKVRELAKGGVGVVGPAPKRSSTLHNADAEDREVQAIAAALWGGRSGAGRVIDGATAHDVLAAQGLAPDFQYSSDHADATVEAIHRRGGGAEIYFVASRLGEAQGIRATFRVAGRAPELWDAVTGGRRFASAYTAGNGTTTVPFDLAPFGSCFVIFREPASAHPASSDRNGPHFAVRQKLEGPWAVRFDPRWGGPAEATFDSLSSWTVRPEEGIRFYSGTATYRKVFDVPAGLSGRSLCLDLGRVRELAEVRLNGRSLGIVWAPPFRVELTGALKPTGNVLEIDVVNFWPNRIIGDQSLPSGQRLTQTNIRKLTAASPLVESGLLGPVQLLERSL